MITIIYIYFFLLIIGFLFLSIWKGDGKDYNIFRQVHHRSLGILSVFIIIALVITYSASWSLGFLFDYLIYLGSIFGDASFLYLPLLLFSIVFPIVFLKKSWSAKRGLQSILFLTFAFLLVIEITLADPVLTQYRKGWSFAWEHYSFDLNSPLFLLVSLLFWFGLDIFLWKKTNKNIH